MQSTQVEILPPAPAVVAPTKGLVDVKHPVILGIKKIRDLSPGRFFYLASPHAKYAYGQLLAAEHIATVAGALMDEVPVNVFSPIAHGHMIRQGGALSPKPHGWWLDTDQAYMDAALGCIVAKLPGWDRSDGVQYEMMYFARHHKPVFVLPVEVANGVVTRIA